MNNIALITGITGQDGSYLAEFLLEKGYEVHGLIRRHSISNTMRIDHLIQSDYYKVKFFLHFADTTDSSNLMRIIGEIRPTEVYNLAAQSHVGVSFEVPEYTADATGVSTLKLLEAIRVMVETVVIIRLPLQSCLEDCQKLRRRVNRHLFIPKVPMVQQNCTHIGLQ